ncbi:MAG TPA: hypothetical protein PK425_10220 [Syntrophales bacterium]|jgi:hypothetical protein|nr:hypothetical protein [Syntrophales bacterium]HQA83120.1 hypothetical protein [Syntrophales bacterium]
MDIIGQDFRELKSLSSVKAGGLNLRTAQSGLITEPPEGDYSDGPAELYFILIGFGGE